MLRVQPGAESVAFQLRCNVVKGTEQRCTGSRVFSKLGVFNRWLHVFLSPLLLPISPSRRAPD